MNLSSPGVSYILLVIPTLLAITVIGHGVHKVQIGEDEGKVAIGFGVIFFLLIAAAYYFFVR